MQFNPKNPLGAVLSLSRPRCLQLFDGTLTFGLLERQVFRNQGRSTQHMPFLVKLSWGWVSAIGRKISRSFLSASSVGCASGSSAEEELSDRHVVTTTLSVPAEAGPVTTNEERAVNLDDHRLHVQISFEISLHSIRSCSSSHLSPAESRLARTSP